MAFFLQMVHYMNKISETRSRVAATVLADIKYHRDKSVENHFNQMGSLSVIFT